MSASNWTQTYTENLCFMSKVKELFPMCINEIINIGRCFAKSFHYNNGCHLAVISYPYSTFTHLIFNFSCSQDLDFIHRLWCAGFFCFGYPWPSSAKQHEELNQTRFDFGMMSLSTRIPTPSYSPPLLFCLNRNMQWQCNSDLTLCEKSLWSNFPQIFFIYLLL